MSKSKNMKDAIKATGIKLTAAPIIDWVLENIKSPCLFGNEDDYVDYNPIAISYYILCFKRTKPITQNVTPSTFQSFYRNCREYLPKKFQTRPVYQKSGGHNLSDASLDYYDKFNLWFENMQTKIEMGLANQYLTQGQKKYLDILERRFANNWNLNSLKTIQVDAGNDTDNKLSITITEVAGSE